MSNVADQPVPARSLRRGVLSGVAAGLLAGVVWYLVVIGTTSMQTYLLPAFGVAVAFGVHRGMRRPGRAAALVSLAITLVSLLLAMYYVNRHLVVSWFKANGDVKHIPLVPYFDWMAEVVGHGLTQSPSAPIYAVLALVAAGWFGMQGFDVHDPQRRRT